MTALTARAPDEQTAVKPSAVSVHDCIVAPVRPAQGLLVPAQVGAGAQLVVPLVEPPQARAEPTVVQTGAPGAKQQAAV